MCILLLFCTFVVWKLRQSKTQGTAAHCLLRSKKQDTSLFGYCSHE